MMTIEEKAKAYDEALERAKNFIENGDQGEKTIAESIFAGLIDGESEDERIRKSIIRLLQVGGYMPLEDKEKAFAYLEKQKELPFVKDVVLGCPGLYFYDGERMHFRGPVMEEKQEESLRDFIDNFPYDEQKEQKPKRERKKPKESWLSKLKYELAHEEELLIERGKELSEIGALKNKDQKEQKSSIVKKLREISTPADEDWFEIEKKWEAEDNEDLRSFISVKFASNAKVIDGKRFAVFTWERFKDIALELVNRGKEKQKEQKPLSTEETELNSIAFLEQMGYTCIPSGKEQKPEEKKDYSDLNDLEGAIHRGFLSAGVENVPVTIIKETEQECLAQMKPAEWSEEDEIRRESCMLYLANTRDCIEFNQHIGDNARESGKKEIQKDIDWLKSLRPSWKPSEEQMEALNYAYSELFKREDVDHNILGPLQNLIDTLTKL